MIHRLNLKTMGLSFEQIKELLKEQPRKNQIAKAVAHESRLKFHNETILQKSDLPTAYNEFLWWVGGRQSRSDTHPKLLPEDKFKRFKQLLQTPIPTVELSEAINTKLHRVFSAEDAHREYSFTSDGLEDDFTEFYDPVSFWSTKGFDAMRTGINSVWVADLPAELSDEPEPYGYLIPIGTVLDIFNNEEGECEWLMFAAKGEEYLFGGKRFDDYLLVYDETSIRKFTFANKKIGELVVEFFHKLGYTPARQMWTDRLVSDDYINRKSPFSASLNDLDYYLFMLTNQKYMELANSYPITIAYEDAGDMSNIEGKDDNKSDDVKQPIGDDFMGAGSFNTVPAPLPGEVDMMAHPVQVISPDVPSLDYHVRRIEEMRDKIFVSIAGADDERTNDQAQNELQIKSTFESRLDVLTRIKKNFETIEQFSTETLARLRYDNRFESYEVDYGSEFFLKSLSGLQEDYREALESGADPVLLGDLKDSIIAYRYRNNPTGRMRAKLITDLTPYRDKTVEELVMLNTAGLLDDTNFQIRLNLLDFIARFERENAPLEVWGKNLEYKKRLENLRSEIETYVLSKTKPLINGTD